MRRHLFVDGEPCYQPAINHGYRYREPWSRSTMTGWFRGTEEDPWQEEVSRETVAEALNVPVPELIKWENATDLEAEAESRAEFGDY